MKRLTMNQVATANLKHNRKAYVSLVVGIFLAVYLACAAVLCVYGTLAAKEEQMARRVGWADTLLVHDRLATDDDLRNSGFFDRIGHVYVTAGVKDTEVFFGYYDETAANLMYRQCLEGRMPEAVGEIAAERSALDKLGLEDASVGDTFTFDMQPFDGLSEKRAYTLVGILNEQSTYLDHSSWFGVGYGTAKFPAVLTVSEEPAYAVGNPEVHRVMTNRPLVTLTEIQALETDAFSLSSCSRVSRVSGKAIPFDTLASDAAEKAQQVIVWVLLGGALMLSTCVAISSAMESMLAQKTQDIGMLRAVGATRRQIRRLFGRDAWLLALTALPVGMALGCLTCWLIACLSPGEMLFRPRVWLLLPVLALSFLCVFFSSMLPLRRASRQLPMGVLRDTDTLRRARRFRSRKTFEGTKLIASRQFRLHPLRQAGSACMAALMLMCMLLLGEMVMNIDWSEMRDQAAFTLTAPRDASFSPEPFIKMKKDNRGLTENDVRQLRALPMVSSVSNSTETMAVLRFGDPVPAYFKTYPVSFRRSNGSTSLMDVFVAGQDTNYLSFTDASTVDDFPDEFSYMSAVNSYRQMRVLQRVSGTQENLLPVMVYITPVGDMDLTKNIVDGDIDLAALDEGREVLIYAPAMGVKTDIDGYIADTLRDDEIDPDQWDLVIRNDYFRAGQTLDMMQLFGEMPDWFWNSTDESQLERYYSETERSSFTTKVGAVLQGTVRIGNTRPYGMCMITTQKGAAALGIQSNGIESVSIHLTGDPDPTTEELLDSAIRRIGMRRDMEFMNRLASNRENRAYQTRVLALFGGMVLLFFAVSVSMQVTNASRRIRADERMVGTLRAVGADERALMRCYRFPAIVSAIYGFALASGVYLLLPILFPLMFFTYHRWLLAAALVMAALNTLCAIVGVRRQLHRVVGKSIIENIREL